MIDLVFFGSPEFAVPSLLALEADERVRVVLVVTQPDRPAGRGRRLAPPPVKVAAEERGLPVWQPETLRTPGVAERLATLAPDLFVVAAYGEILRPRLLAIPRHGTLNVHPSLLPAFRGSAPIPAAILSGQPATGVSIMLLVRRLDAGPVVAQQSVALSGNETAGELSERLGRHAAGMLPDVCDGWVRGELVARAQNEERASYSQRLGKDDGLLDWHATAVELELRVRAMAPWPGAWATLDGRRIGVEQAALGGELLGVPPGQITIVDGRALVRCGAGSLELVRVRPQGRAGMPAADWLRGLRSEGPVRFDDWFKAIER